MSELAEVIEMQKTTPSAGQWQVVCEFNDIAPDAGICALVGEEHVAIFRLRNDDLYALANYDPIGQASVMSRGIVGSFGDRFAVASPLYKQHFDLQTGECLEEEGIALKTFRVRLQDGKVEVLQSS